MTIGLVLASSPAYSETFFHSKIKGLNASGYKVILFCSKNSENFKSCQVALLPKRHSNIIILVFNVLWVYFGLIPFLKSVRRFIKLERNNDVSLFKILSKLYLYAPIFRNKIDWLHFGFGSLAIGAENIAASKRAKMAVSFRGFDIGVYPLKFPNCYMRLWEKVTKIHVISDDIHSLLYRHGFNDEAMVVKITPAIDTNFFTNEHFYSHNKNLPIQIVTVARLHWKKGLNYTIQALALLKNMGIKFNYSIIGNGPELEALKYEAYRNNLQDDISFLGQLKPSEIKSELINSSIYIQYSVQEGFCNAVLEAQSLGLLCIVSDAEGLSENVLNGKSGWVVPKRDPLLLMKKIQMVVDLSESEKEHVRKFAKERVSKEFSITEQQKKFVQFYSQI